MSKYNELMQNIVVTEDMKSRILRNIELELDGRDVLGGDERKRSSESGIGSNGGGSNDIEKVISIDEAGNEKKIRSFGHALRGKWSIYVAAALVFILSGIVIKSIIGDPSHSSSIPMMSEDSYDPTPAPAAAEEAAASEEPINESEPIGAAKDAADDVAKDTAEGAAVAENTGRFEYEEKATLATEYSIGNAPAVFHLAQVKNVSGDDIEPPYYAEFYQGDAKLKSIYLSENMMRMSMGDGETFGLVWGCLLENETEDVRIVVTDQKSPDKKVLFEKTYTMDELKASASALPAGYSSEKQLSDLFDAGVITE